MKITAAFSFLSMYTVHSFISVGSTERPIIGILSQEFSIKTQYKYPLNSTYIAASYVKAVETSGARVIPILAGREKNYYRSLMKSINGIVFPGGETKLERGYQYYDAITMIYEIAIEMNDNGTYFPIFAICLGFEAILTVANNHKQIRTTCKIFHENYPLNFRKKYEKSMLFSNVPLNVLFYLKYMNVTINNHIYCIHPTRFENSSLPKWWRVTADTISKDGTKFIASVEHRNYPFIALQFHPEKIFEWTANQNNPHHFFALIANRYFYDIFVLHARRNNNAFADEEEGLLRLIYNFSPIYNNSKNATFSQIYLFLQKFQNTFL